MSGRRRLGLVIAGALLLSVPGSSALGAFSAPVLLRESNLLRVQGIATGGGAVAVGWREGSKPGQLWVRVSPDKGASFKPKYAVAGLPKAGMSLAMCSDQVWAASAARYPNDADGDSDLLLSRRGVSGGGGSQVFLTQPGKTHSVREPDIACVGNDLLAIAWLDRAGSETRAYLLIRDQASLLPSATDVLFDLGRARIKGGIGVAATDSSVYVAWSRTDRQDLTFRSFRIEGGSDPAIKGSKAVTLARADAVLPEVAARGEKVIVAYTDAGLLKMRSSSDGGKTFGGAKTLIKAGSLDVPALATSADLRGKRIVIEALRRPPKTASVRLAAAERVPYRLETRDSGAKWSNVQLGNRGSRLGVLRPISGGDSLLLEAWHDDGSSDRIRFQRELQ
jgi:hypothetical protein